MSYETTVLADTPVAYWPLNDPGTYTDATGHGYNLSSIGSTPATTPGPVAGETAPLFSGSNGLFRASTFSYDPHASGVEQPFSVEFWVYQTTANFGTAFWYGDNKSAHSADIIAFSYHVRFNDGAFQPYGQNAATFIHYNPFSAPSTLDTSLWNHIVWTFDTSVGYTYYLNGVSQSTINSQSSYNLFFGTPADTSVYIGNLPGEELSVSAAFSFPIVPFIGAIAHMAFYDFALSSTQVTNHYSAVSVPTPTLSIPSLNYDTATTMQLQIGGNSWTPSTTITVSLNGTSIGTTSSDLSGAFSASISVPQQVAGTYLIEVTDGTSSLKTYVVLFLPRFDYANESTLSSGDSFEIFGLNLIPSSVVTVSVDSTVVGTTTSDAFGDIDYTFTMPVLSPGRHSIYISDPLNQGHNEIYIIYESTASASTNYRSEVMSDNPVAFLPLTESGSSIADISSGGTHTGTRLNGFTDTGAGIFTGETAVYLNLSNPTLSPLDYISFANPSTLPLRNSFSYETWISPQLSGGRYFADFDQAYIWLIDHVVSTFSLPLLGQTFSFGVPDTLQTDKRFPGDTIDSPAESLYFYSNGEYIPNNTKGEVWFHIVTTWDGNNTRYYINGKTAPTSDINAYSQDYPPVMWRGIILNQPETETISGAYIGGTSSVGGPFGPNEFWNAWWQGRVAYFAVYDHALSPDRIACHWNAAVTGDACTPPPPPPSGQFAVLARVYRNQLVIHQNLVELT